MNGDWLSTTLAAALLKSGLQNRSPNLELRRTPPYHATDKPKAFPRRQAEGVPRRQAKGVSQKTSRRRFPRDKPKAFPRRQAQGASQKTSQRLQAKGASKKTNRRHPEGKPEASEAISPGLSVSDIPGFHPPAKTKSRRDCSHSHHPTATSRRQPSEARLPLCHFQSALRCEARVLSDPQIRPPPDPGGIAATLDHPTRHEPNEGKPEAGISPRENATSIMERGFSIRTEARSAERRAERTVQ